MSKEKLREDFYKAVKDSYLKYLRYGDRSVEKLKPLHQWIGETIKSLIPREYEVHFINGKEVQTEGEYYTKIIDVAIVKKGVSVISKRGGFKPLFYIPQITVAISIKFITSNFKQNANNYFEVLLGECANLRAKGVKFGHFVVFRDKIPYFTRSGKLAHWEILRDEDMSKYIKLSRESQTFLHTPNFIGLEIVNLTPIVEEIYSRKPKFSERLIQKLAISIGNGIKNTNLKKEIRDFIEENFNLFKFFKALRSQL